jgi:hypothetical protein
MHTTFIAEMEQDRELLDPRVIAAAAALGMTVMKAKETAARLNISLLAMLGLKEAPVGQIVEKYVLGGPLVNPKEEGGLSTNMQNLFGCYKMHIKRTSNVISWRTLERSITSKDTRYIFNWTNCFIYSISTNSTYLSSLPIVCK